MMLKPRIYADFQNVDALNRLRLNSAGTLEDLARQRVELREGMPVTLYADDVDDQGQLDELQVEGLVSFSIDEQCWVAKIDWKAIGHTSDCPAPSSPPPSIPIVPTPEHPLPKR